VEKVVEKGKRVTGCEGYQRRSVGDDQHSNFSP
jgi:hypothetical protein